MNGTRRIFRSKFRRLSVSAALASVACLVVAQIALADVEVGSAGNYQWPDAAANSSGATCRYTRDTNDPDVWWLTRIVAKPPTVWWPDSNAESTTEHGRVGWQFFIEYHDGVEWNAGPASTIQKATAYESTAAPFTNMGLNVNGRARPMGQWRIVEKVIRYRPDGKVKGYALHEIEAYSTKLGQQAVFPGTDISCSSRWEVH
jgi:hypothetical protein